MAKRARAPKFPHIRIVLRDPAAAEKDATYFTIMELMEQKEVSALDRKLFTEAWMHRTSNLLGLYQEWVSVRIRNPDADVDEDDEEDAEE